MLTKVQLAFAEGVEPDLSVIAETSGVTIISALDSAINDFNNPAISGMCLRGRDAVQVSEYAEQKIRDELTTALSGQFVLTANGLAAARKAVNEIAEIYGAGFTFKGPADLTI